MASYTHHHPDDTIVMSSRKQHQQQQQPPQLHDSYLQSLEAMPSLPPLSHLLTSEQAAAAAVAASATPDHNSSAVQSPLSTSSSSVNTTPRTLAYIPRAASTTASAMYYTQPPVIPPTVPSATMMMPTQGSHVYPLDAHFLPLDSTTSMANINPYPSIAPRRERNSSVSSTASSDTNKVYSFVAIPGTNQKKRPRRRYDEIERLYHCNWQGCSKAYGTLNHLNAHVSMQKHGSKRSPAEFKEMRKEWRRQKKEREAAKKAADEHMKKEMIHHHHQQQQQQQQFVAAAAAAAAAMPLHPPYGIPTSHYQPLSISPNYGMSTGLPGFY